MSETRDQSQEGHPKPGESLPQPGYPQEENPMGENPALSHPGLQPPGYEETLFGDRDNTPPDYNKLGLDEVKKFDFTTQSERKAFLGKVYSIMACQLLLTRTILALIVLPFPSAIWSYNAIWCLPFYYLGCTIFWVALVFALGCLVIAWRRGIVNRKAPKNFIYLGIFTLAESYLLAAVTSIFYLDGIMSVVGIMAAVCLALTIYALQTKWDYNTFGAILLCTIIAFVPFNISVLIVREYEVMVLFFAMFCALLFSIYLVYDTQLMMGGKHKYSVSSEEYVFAVHALNMDIITIYPLILAIIRVCRNKNYAQVSGQAVKV